MKNKRLDYIDNIRILLTVVVLLNHISITYGAPGGWYYREFDVNQLSLIPLTLLVLFAAGNQAYSMGFFFLISGFFSARSLSRKGPRRFLLQRSIRLGLPVLFFVYFVSPLLRLSLRKILYGVPINLEKALATYQQINFGVELGPMWFIMLLLIFSLILSLANDWLQKISSGIKIPSRTNMILLTVAAGFVTFLIRIEFSIGTVFQPLNLQVSNLFQYILSFFFGAVSYHANWEPNVKSLSTRFWIPFTVGTIFLMPVLFIASGGAAGDVTPALGGLYWQSLALSVWEQLFCLGMASSLLILFFRYLNQQTKFSQELAASSYATFVFHPLVLVIFTTSLIGFNFPPLLKISLVAVPAVLLCFVSASLLRRLPGLRSIL